MKLLKLNRIRKPTSLDGSWWEVGSQKDQYGWLRNHHYFLIQLNIGTPNRLKQFQPKTKAAIQPEIIETPIEKLERTRDEISIIFEYALTVLYEKPNRLFFNSIRSLTHIIQVI